MKKSQLFLFGFVILNASVYSQPGRIGINTTTPLAMLHVRDSSVIFTGGSSFSNNPGNTSSYNGVQMLWIADRGAFRIGHFQPHHLTSDVIGPGSIAAGQYNRAIGYNSAAFGYTCYAIGNSSIAAGNSNSASGSASVAMGNGARASGSYAVALGSDSWAVGNASLATGHNTMAFGTYSHAFGYYTEATGHHSTAFGVQTHSRAHTSFVIGRFNDSIISSSPDDWFSDDPLFIIGNGNSNFSRKNAMIVLKDARTGINTSNPYTKLHVSDGPSGVATESTNVVAFFENDASAFLQLASPTANETGILSASPATNIRGGIVFTTDSAISFRTGGNNTRFQISKTGEFTKSATGSANLVPVCYGSVAAAGTINSGSSNFSVVNSATGEYTITITGENYLSSNFATTVSVISGTSFRLATTGASGGNLVIRILDINGNLVNASFHFIVFKP